MVVCRFFLQGNCRYGELCKFDHQTGGGTQNASILRQQNFNPNTNIRPQNTTTVDTNTLIQSVVNDMTSAEKGGQWILSSYAPFKEKAPFSGFDDHSFEEIRWGFYEAQLNGTVPQYCQGLQALLQNTIMHMKMLQNPTPEIINIIMSIYYSTSNAPTNTAFSTNQTSASSFFAAANNKFFGGQPVQQTNPTQSVFGNSVNVNQNPFPQPQQQLFQQPQSFQQLQQSFGTAVPANTNIFKVDQAPLANPSPFQSSSQDSQSSFFGSNQNTVIQAVQKPHIKDETVYSKPEDLTKDEVDRFESDNFEFGNIPEKPPTIQMCF